MRVCVVYDCLFPHTVGGAERWYRNLSERLAEEGHEVTYLTLRQWPRGESPNLRGVGVVTAGPRMDLYRRGRRRIGPPLRFGWGVLWHLARHGRRYDVVHTASFPYFSLLAAGLVRRLHDFRLVVDWHEVWTPDYWREYLGKRWGGSAGSCSGGACAFRNAPSASRDCTRRGSVPRESVAKSRCWRASTRGPPMPRHGHSLSPWWSSPGATSPRSGLTAWFRNCACPDRDPRSPRRDLRRRT